MTLTFTVSGGGRTSSFELPRPVRGAAGVEPATNLTNRKAHDSNMTEISAPRNKAVSL